MTRGNRLFLLLLVWLASVVAAQTSDPPSSENGDVIGHVTLVGANPHADVKDASRVVVWLVPEDAADAIRSGTQQRNYRMAQHNKTFEPDFLVVPLGSVVNFPNLDPWFHNVFSLYRGKRFDLGLYEAGAEKGVRFDRPGVSYLFCNIHPEMTAVVLTVDSAFYGVSDKAGHLSIANVPRGKYLLRVWYENASPQTLQALEQPVTIDSDTHALPSIALSVNKQDWAKHKNKYGSDYDPKALTPDY